MYKYYYKTPVGIMCIKENDGYITEIHMGKDSDTVEEIETKLIRKTYEEIMRYFSKKRKSFDIPIKLEGTEFQKRVWDALIQIPYGKTCTYKDIAEKIGNPKACRAVGGANNKNPIMIIVPCHRVIGKNGDLVGYAGGIEVKQKLLDLEQGKF